jgi:hypothetical protein
MKYCKPSDLLVQTDAIVYHRGLAVQRSTFVLEAMGHANGLLSSKSAYSDIGTEPDLLFRSFTALRRRIHERFDSCKSRGKKSSHRQAEFDNANVC